MVLGLRPPSLWSTDSFLTLCSVVQKTQILSQSFQVGGFWVKTSDTGRAELSAFVAVTWRVDVDAEAWGACASSKGHAERRIEPVEAVAAGSCLA